MHCSVCTNTDFTLLYTQGNSNQFKFYLCKNCGLVNYDQTSDLDQAKYAARLYDPHDLSLKTNKAQSLTYDFLKLYITTPGKMLDIGCGNGHLLYCAQNDGWQVEGLELSSELAIFVKKTLGINVIVENFLNYSPDSRKQYNCVILRHVLEHLPDPNAAMKKIHSMLAPNGMAIFEFPNIMGLDYKIKRFIRNIGLHRKKYRENYLPGHCHEFSKRSFHYLAEKTGYNLIRLETYSIRPLANLFYNYLRIGNKARALVQKK